MANRDFFAHKYACLCQIMMRTYNILIDHFFATEFCQIFTTQWQIFCWQVLPKTGNFTDWMIQQELKNYFWQEHLPFGLQDKLVWTFAFNFKVAAFVLLLPMKNDNIANRKLTSVQYFITVPQKKKSGVRKHVSQAGDRNPGVDACELSIDNSFCSFFLFRKLEICPIVDWRFWNWSSTKRQSARMCLCLAFADKGAHCRLHLCHCSNFSPFPVSLFCHFGWIACLVA